MSHDLDALLLEVTDYFGHVSRRVHLSWVDLDEVDAELFDEVNDYACCDLSKPGEAFIGLHPKLKRAPRYVVFHVICHEILHVELPPRGRCWHHRAFRLAERLCRHFKRSEQWFDHVKNWVPL